MKRRVLLAQTLVASPDCCCSTSRRTIWTSKPSPGSKIFSPAGTGTLIFVTHDRMFLRKLATRILEIDRGPAVRLVVRLRHVSGAQRAALAAEEKQNALFDKRLAEEEVWIRQGIKARRTRNEGRVRALEQMRRDAQRAAPGQCATCKLAIHEGQRSGALRGRGRADLSFAYRRADDRSRFLHDDHARRQDRHHRPQRRRQDDAAAHACWGNCRRRPGKVRLGTNLQIAYFDQRREQLDDERTVAENVADGYDTVPGGGSPRHIIGYLQDFLFSPERARTPVRFLSGGERNRVLLARLFAKPANVIVLDEPTNDLDTETLELLEERLVQFERHRAAGEPRSRVSQQYRHQHDRVRRGDVREYVGGYDDWLRQRPVPTPASDRGQGSGAKGQTPDASLKTASGGAAIKRRLNYNEQREQAALPGLIEGLEAQIAALHEAMAQSEFYKQPGERIAEEQARSRVPRTAARRRISPAGKSLSNSAASPARGVSTHSAARAQPALCGTESSSRATATSRGCTGGRTRRAFASCRACRSRPASRSPGPGP